MLSGRRNGMGTLSRARAAGIAAALVVAAALLPLRAQEKPPAAPPPAAPASDAEFTKAVNAAVDRGDAWLAKQQQEDGGFGVFHFHRGRDYVAGKTALALLARIAAGGNPNSEPIERGFAYLLKNPPKLTYEVGLTLMAFDARCAPVGELQQVARMSAAELAKYAFPRALRPGDKEYLQPLVERLAKERYRECWSYGNYATGFAAREADMSNTQYAALGLKAASRLGLDFDRALFADLLDYVLDHQGTKSVEVKWIDVQEGADGKAREYARKVDARGFCYPYGARDEAELCASRACIAIACIELALDDLLTKGKGEPLARARKRRRDAAKAVESQLAWLQHHFAVDRNPTSAGGAAGYWLYYLYALERVGALTGRKWIGRHDWYREGAEELLRRQRPDGSWESGGYDDELVNTCFALLFLKRATLRGSVTASGD
jgi:hypothetical protein